jgi:intracellular septation protein A
MTSSFTTKPVPGPGMHPLIHAGRWLVSDMLSTLAFVALYAVTDNIYLATGLGIGFGFAQIAWMKLRGTPVDVLQWMSLGLVCVFGGATLLTQNPVFIMLKPTLIYTAVGAVMLRPGWMNRYMPPIALARGGDIIFAFGYVWAGLMFSTAAANLVLALYTDKHTWEWFLGIFPLGSKLVLFAIQYLTTRFIVRRRILAELPSASAAVTG